MNRKYIDFVPKNGKKPVASRVVVAKTATEARTTVTKSEIKPKSSMAAEVNEFEVSDVFEAYDEKMQKRVTDYRPRFVKTEVEKRPLSKNVYQKKAVVPREEKPSKPVTIIHKPEKDSKVGLIVAIIITIILGAAAGTVAFLLLPK